MKANFQNVTRSGIQSVIPRNKLNFQSLCSVFGESEANKIISTTGITCVRVAPRGVAASDLCFEAAQLLLRQMKALSDEINGLVLVSQTRDFLLPQSSTILQQRLGLLETTGSFDLPIDCSGFIYDHLQASKLINSGACEKVLSLTGDT
jgi:3-oxoacyl-[acyl-carrier-protein] synthase-3